MNFDSFDFDPAIKAGIKAAGRGESTSPGRALTFVTGKDGRAVKDPEHLLNTKIERCTLQGFEYMSPPPARKIKAFPRQRRRVFTSVPRSSGIPA